MRTNFLACAIFATFLVGPAEAADFTPPEPAAYDWTGTYLGLFGGKAWADVKLKDLDNYNGVAGDFSYDGDGFYGGVFLGHNWQSNWFVYGLEAELAYLGLDGSKQFPPYVGVRTPNDSRASINSDFEFLLAGRLGIAWDRVLIYGKAGVSGLNTDVSFIDPDPIGITLVSGTSGSDFLIGPAFGGGVEIAFSDTVTGRIEFMRRMFGSINHTALTSTGLNDVFKHDIDNVDSVMAGIAIKLWGP